MDPTKSRPRTSTVWLTLELSCRTITSVPAAPPAELLLCQADILYMQVHQGLNLSTCQKIFAGMQHRVIHADMPYGLPLDVKIMPQYLNDLGYTSHLVGKWHLGHHSRQYTPTFRGFSSFTGCWTGKQDFYNHTNDNGDREAREKLLVEVHIYLK